MIGNMYPSATLIAGVATGAVAYGAMVADQLDLPFAYVRPSAKAHGLTNMVEGMVRTSDKVVVIEDLVSTGKSSLSAVRALKTKGCEIMGMLAIFTYQFDIAAENFFKSSCHLETLTDYHVLIEVAEEMGIVDNKQLATLKEWRDNPSTWNG